MTWYLVHAALFVASVASLAKFYGRAAAARDAVLKLHGEGRHEEVGRLSARVSALLWALAAAGLGALFSAAGVASTAGLLTLPRPAPAAAVALGFLASGWFWAWEPGAGDETASEDEPTDSGAGSPPAP